MKRILLSIEHPQNRHLLSQWLAEQYQILSPTKADFLTVGDRMLASS